jgi:hypothetical protein
VSPALRPGRPGRPRRHGLAAAILAADGVTAGSPAVRADHTHNPDLLGVRGASACAPARGMTQPRCQPQEGEAPAAAERDSEKQGENHGRQRI